MATADILKNPFEFESQAKATEGKAGMAGRCIVMQIVVTWTDQQVRQLKKLRAEGLSARQIANKLGGMSRHAVIGKIRRLGLSQGVPSDQRMGRVITTARATKAVPALVEETFKPRVADVVSCRIPILDLKAMECRWPDEDRDPDTGLHTFCGNRTGDGSSYCPAHAALSQGPGTSSERAVAPMPKERAA